MGKFYNPTISKQKGPLSLNKEIDTSKIIKQENFSAPLSTSYAEQSRQKQIKDKDVAEKLNMSQRNAHVFNQLDRIPSFKYMNENKKAKVVQELNEKVNNYDAELASGKITFKGRKDARTILVDIWSDTAKSRVPLMLNQTPTGFTLGTATTSTGGF